MRALCCVVVATTGLAQTRQGVADPERTLAKQALRHVRLLELPKRRAQAAADLLALGSKVVPTVARCLEDPRPEVVNRLVLILRDFGAAARTAEPTLRKLAKSEDAAIARAARYALAPFDAPRIYLVTNQSGDARELGPKGDELRKIGKSKGAFGGERLPNGNYLFAMLSRSVVQELDTKGKVVWETKAVQSPTAATRLASDHTLICSIGKKEVIEVDAKGKVVWRHACNTPYSAQRLTNGNTLIADYSGQQTFEVTPKGKRVWKYSDLKGPIDAQRLANGNTLIVSHSQKAVHEVKPDGRAVLKIKLPAAGWAVRRLSNGDTLAAGQNFLACYDKGGKARWTKRGGGTTTSVRIY